MRKPHDPSLIIRKAREFTGLNQEEFGQKIGRPQSLVSKYERGMVEPPGHVVIHCMTILKGVEGGSKVSSTEVAQIIEKRLKSPRYAKLRMVLAELVNNIAAEPPG